MACEFVDALLQFELAIILNLKFIHLNCLEPVLIVLSSG